jgi:hypothetical protein
MFALSKQVKSNIEKSTGLSVKEISEMSAEKVDAHIEKRLGKKLIISLPDDIHLMGRGSVYIALRRLISSKKTNEKLAQI